MNKEKDFVRGFLIGLALVFIESYLVGKILLIFCILELIFIIFLMCDKCYLSGLAGFIVDDYLLSAETFRPDLFSDIVESRFGSYIELSVKSLCYGIMAAVLLSLIYNTFYELLTIRMPVYGATFENFSGVVLICFVTAVFGYLIDTCAVGEGQLVSLMRNNTDKPSFDDFKFIYYLYKYIW